VEQNGTFTHERKGRCVRPAVKPTCRLPQFGIDRYKNCRHESHGVESYKSCARAEFGVKRYKQREYYLDEDEVERHITTTRTMLDFMATTLVTHMGNFYFMVGDEIGLGCTIKRLGRDPLYEDITGELEQYYATRFANRDPHSLDCTQSAPDVDINTYQCAEDDSGSICNTLRQYLETKAWFVAKKQDVINLRADYVARQDARIRGLLDQLQRDLEQKDL